MSGTGEEEGGGRLCSFEASSRAGPLSAPGAGDKAARQRSEAAQCLQTGSDAVMVERRHGRAAAWTMMGQTETWMCFNLLHGAPCVNCCSFDVWQRVIYTNYKEAKSVTVAGKSWYNMILKREKSLLHWFW